MNLNQVLVRLYPSSWRARYGEEFTALLEERPVGPFDVADILFGALDARLRLRHLHVTQDSGGVSMSLRIGGIAAIAGAGLLLMAALVNTGVVVHVDGLVPGVLFVGGLVCLLVALAGMSAFQSRAHPVLAWVAFAVPALGTLASMFGLVGVSIAGDSAWSIWFFGTMTALVGSALFALMTYRTAALSRVAAALLGMGSLLPFAGFALPDFAPLLIAAIASFLLGWFLLGVQAIRIDHAATQPRPA